MIVNAEGRGSRLHASDFAESRRSHFFSFFFRKILNITGNNGKFQLSSHFSPVSR